MAEFVSPYSDEIRAWIDEEFPPRENDGHYLDHCGSALCHSSMAKHAAASSALANPHSSQNTKCAVDEARRTVLAFFNANAEDDYRVVFTSGATAAAKLVADCFGWKEDGAFLYLRDAHTSVVGIREVARSKGAKVMCLDDEEHIFNIIAESYKSQRCLLSFPAMSNFCGRKYNLDLIDRVRNVSDKWRVLLDAAAFVSTNPLDLSVSKPDFVCLSFYKLLGLPTGLGALIVRKTALEELRANKVYFGGGTVEMHLVEAADRVLRSGASLEESLEDGTSHFQGILCLERGFQLLSRIPGKAVAAHTFALARYLFHSLRSLRYDNDQRLVEVYCGGSDFGDSNVQGPIVTFNVLHRNGAHLGFAAFKRLAEQESVIVRAGCFCNVGACQRYLGFSDNDLLRSHQQGHVCGDDVDLLDDGRPLGAIRVSFGHYSRKEDADKIVQLLQENFLAVRHLDNSECVGDTSGAITAISVYPLKSCAPMRVGSWPLSPDGGLLFDRQWAVFQGEKCITQKQSKTLCLVQPQIDLPSAHLTLSFPGLASISIPIEDNFDSVTRLDVCVGNVCGDGIRGFDCGPDVSAWLEKALGLPGLRLVRSVARASRSTSSLANDGQFLVLNSASARFLGQRLRERQGDSSNANDLEWILRQFRGNLVVDGPSAFSEDTWDTLRVGSRVVLERHRTCKRCAMISVNQTTGQEVGGLVQVLTKIPERRFAFGTLFSLRTEPGSLEVRVGDRVEINAVKKNIGS